MKLWKVTIEQPYEETRTALTRVFIAGAESEADAIRSVLNYVPAAPRDKVTVHECQSPVCLAVFKTDKKGA